MIQILVVCNLFNLGYKQFIKSRFSSIYPNCLKILNYRLHIVSFCCWWNMCKDLSYLSFHSILYSRFSSVASARSWRYVIGLLANWLSFTGSNILLFLLVAGLNQLTRSESEAIFGPTLELSRTSRPLCFRINRLTHCRAQSSHILFSSKTGSLFSS